MTNQDKALDYTVTLRKPHEMQERFLNSQAKRVVIRAGRRGGKTTGMGIKAVTAFAQGRRVLYAAPTEDQIASFWWARRGGSRPTPRVRKAKAAPTFAGSPFTAQDFGL